MKKALFFFIFLILATLAVFYFGWVQFAVPAGMSGVLISRTTGVNAKPVENGVFRWQWERLIPKNSEIRLFSKTPVSASNTVAGQLPSAAAYGSLLPGKPDFAYDFTVQTVLAAKPASLPALTAQYNLANQAELESWLDTQAKNVAQAVADFLLTQTEEADLTTENYAAGINAAANFPAIDIIAITVTFNKMPDLALYQAAKATYQAYERETRSALALEAEKQAVGAAADSLEISRLKNWGDLLNQYPVLIDFFAVTNGTADPLTALENLRASRVKSVPVPQAAQ